MRDDAIVAYKNPPGDAEAELASLGDAFAENVLLFCQSIVAGEDAHGGIDHWDLLPFETYRGVPIYNYAYRSRFALVAVEDDGAGDRRVSIMLAARAEMRAVIDGKTWDGFDIVALRESFLGRRLQDYFR